MWSVRETVTSPCPLGGVPSVRHEFRDRERRCQTALHLGLACRGFPRARTFCGLGDAPPQLGLSFSPGRASSAVERQRAPAPSLGALPSPALRIRGPAWMLPFRGPWEDGPAATRVKTPEGHQVLPGTPAPARRTRGSLSEAPAGELAGLRKGQRWVSVAIGLGFPGVKLEVVGA